MNTGRQRGGPSRPTGLVRGVGSFGTQGMRISPARVANTRLQKHCIDVPRLVVRDDVSRHRTGAFSQESQRSLLLNVGDVMTTKENIITCSPDTLIDDALELIVQHEITGLPVVDPVTNTVVGIISDFDLLALEGVSEEEKRGGLFPEAGDDWSSFFTVQKYVEKNKGKTVADIMTTEPVCVRIETSMSSAAHLLLHKRIRRLPVIDGDGCLVGIITRSNIIKAAWESRKQ